MSPADRATLYLEFAGRFLFACLAGAYFSPLPVETGLLFTALALYLATQGALLYRALGPRAPRWLSPVSTLLDAVVAVGALASDPAAVPPTAVLLPAAALNAVLRGGWAATFIALSAASAGAAIALALREQLYSAPTVPAFGYLLAFLFLALAGLAAQARRQSMLQDHARRFANQDPETQLLNRRGFDDAAGYLVPLHQRTQLPLVIMLVSLDTRAATPLDAPVLAASVRQVGHLVRQRARRSDVVARLSDDEFIFMLFDTPLAGGETLARALGERFGAWTSQQGLDARLTFGMVNTPDEPVAIDQLIARARGAVQRAQKHPSAPSVVTAPSL